MNEPADYAGDRRSVPYSNTKEHWHLSKSFNISTLIVIFLSIVSGLTFVNSLAGDVERIEQIQQIQNDDVKEAIDDLKEENKVHYQEIQRQNDRLEDKMDRIIDKVISINEIYNEN